MPSRNTYRLTWVSLRSGVAAKRSYLSPEVRGSPSDVHVLLLSRACKELRELIRSVTECECFSWRHTLKTQIVKTPGDTRIKKNLKKKSFFPLIRIRLKGSYWLLLMIYIFTYSITFHNNDPDSATLWGLSFWLKIHKAVPKKVSCYKLYG